MMKEETATKADLLRVLDLTETSGIRYWPDGGWGVGMLLGKQTREYGDMDINSDARYTDTLLRTLVSYEYEITTDWRPVRIKLYHPELGYVNIHPFVINGDRATKQADLEGGWYELEADYLGSAVSKGRTIPCTSAKGQKIFHAVHKFRRVNKHDICIVGYLLSAQSSDKDETEGAVCRVKKQLRN